MAKFTLYIDEAGDAGLDKIRNSVDGKGASPFLIFGGCLIRNEGRADLLETLESVRAAIGREDLHSTKLNHFQTALYARRVGTEARVKLFAFISTKATIGDYRRIIEGKGKDQRYYNKCVSYFLEQVGHFLLLHDIDPEELDIIFEKRNSHNYEKLRRYIGAIKKNPIDPRSAFYLQPILPDKITAQPKTADPLLCYADLVAFSVSAAINASAANFGVPEQRYLRELKSKFFADKGSGAIGEFGLKVFKRYNLKLDTPTREFIDSWHVAGVEASLHKQT